jgi:hypothetical protein
MRIPIAFGVAATSVFLFAIFLDITSTQTQIRRQTLVSYAPPAVPEEFKGQITYPLASQDPSGNPTATDDGPAIYRSLHREGWNGCLSSFYVNHQCGGKPIWTLDRSNDIFWQPQPNHRNVATTDGWFTCVAQLQEQLQAMNEQELRLQLTTHLRRRRQTRRYFLISIGAMLGTISVATAWFHKNNAEQ